MPDPRLLALVTALLFVAGVNASRADYSVGQLQQIEGLILQKDCGALWRYLQENPQIMAGSDALSRELRTFADATSRGQLDCFSARTAQLPLAPTQPLVNFAASQAVIY
ncbi:MAG: hypothetical protein WBC68_02665 [Albidovulum sp.]